MNRTDALGLTAILMSLATVLKVATDANTGFTESDVVTILVMTGATVYHWYRAVRSLLLLD